MFSEKTSVIETIPTSRTHIRLLSAKFMEKVLHAMLPCLTLEILRKVRQHDMSNIHRLFYYSTGCCPDTIVFSHDIEVFTTHYVEKHGLLGKRLEKQSIDDNGVIDWSMQGCFHIVKENDAMAIQHASGT